MSRPLRLEFAGALYHITSRGDQKQVIYFQDSDFQLFLNVLGDVCETYNWVVHAYCLMPNHYHLLIETPEGNLSRGMRQLNGVFTQAINRKYERVGHLFQGRYKAILVEKESYLTELCRYIVLNPVRAGLVKDVNMWRWSSWHNILGNITSPKWLFTDTLLQQFSMEREHAIQAYIKFVAKGNNVKIWEHLQHQVFLGSKTFVEEHQYRLSAKQGDVMEIPSHQRRAPAKSLKQYDARSKNQAEAMCQAYHSGAYTLKQIAEYFGVHYSTVSRTLAKSGVRS
ncbi:MULTISPECIES: transposase [Vibrio]|uniref:REP-associated tyrosine transposase n=1 Tax=Vibrio TaxID=662 RepID=UPI00041325C5|nr:MULTISPECIES: transposase [Vibrio]MPW37212.1 addiction module toxin RelE [Vibrio sp. B1Z05]